MNNQLWTARWNDIERKNLQPGAITLLLISYGTSEVANCFSICKTAALLVPYAYPAKGDLLYAPILDVAIT